MIQLTKEAQKKKATAPAIMERAAVAAYEGPSVATVRPNVASATEGAAPNNPAKLFGLSTSPMIAKPETTAPPTSNRMRIGIISSPISPTSVRDPAPSHPGLGISPLK